MAFNLQAWGRAAARIDGDDIDFGSFEIPVSISVTGNVHRRRDSLAASSNTTIYSDELGDFTFFAIASDLNTRVLFTDTGSNSFCLRLRGTGTANKLGLPLMIGLDETSGNSITINSIAVFNDDATNTARFSALVVE